MILHVLVSIFIVFLCDAVDPLFTGPYCGYGNSLKLYKTAVRLSVAALRVFFNKSITGTLGLLAVFSAHGSVLTWRMLTPPHPNMTLA